MEESANTVTSKNGTSTRSKRTKVITARSAMRTPTSPRLSATFQIRTPPGIKKYAEALAEEHEVKRSKLDSVIYARGLWLSALLQGPGADGSYAGLSELELARKLVASFDRMYAVLDRHNLLSSYVYRVYPPGFTFPQGNNALPLVSGPGEQQEVKEKSLGYTEELSTQ